MRLLNLLLAVICVGGAFLPAQCQFQSVTTQTLGSGCNAGPTGCCLVLATQTQLLAQLDTTNCTLVMSVHALSGCCGVAVPLQTLVFGTQQTFVPLPEFGGLCALHVAPLAYLATATGTFALTIPPNLPPITFAAQAGAFITSSFPVQSSVMTLTDALSITLQ